MPSLNDLLDRWRGDLAAWAIPEHITSAVSDSPWVLPRQIFARRADRLTLAPAGESYERAWAALAPSGTVLDVGAGAGAACLPLAPRTTSLTAIDTDPEMLRLLADRAQAVGLGAQTILGRWPDVAADVPPADVVTSHHVLYNAADLGPFLAALTTHARRMVVVECAACHPLTSLNDLWLTFHGLKRPAGPTAADVLEILDAMGIQTEHTEWTRPAEADYQSMDELVEVTRRRLCLPSERSEDVRNALVDLGVDPMRPGDLGSSGRQVVTIWWEGSA
jgi:SAM-dependent methyltransferase